MMKKVKFVLAAAVMVIALVANFSVSNNAQSYDVRLNGLSKALADGDVNDDNHRGRCTIFNNGCTFRVDRSCFNSGCAGGN